MAAEYCGHAVLTPASRDGGVDVIATAKNDMADVSYAIEAKQYRRVVPFEKVRRLHGAMTKRDAHHGLLVTTAWFGKDSRNYAAESRLTLIDGRRLRYLLAKHCGINSVIPHKKLPPGWSTHDIM
jgi:restriction system protein